MLIILLLFKLAHIYFSSEIYSNIDDYILVYNYIKKSNLLLLFIPLLHKKFKFKGINKNNSSLGKKFYHYLPLTKSCRFINKFTISGFVLLCFIYYINPPPFLLYF